MNQVHLAWDWWIPPGIAGVLPGIPSSPPGIPSIPPGIPSPPPGILPLPPLPPGIPPIPPRIPSIPPGIPDIFLHGESFCGGHFIFLQHNLAITRPKVLNIILSLVILDPSKKPFTVAGQRLVYVDLVISRGKFADFGLYGRQMLNILPNKMFTFCIYFFSLVPLEKFINYTVFDIL